VETVMADLTEEELFSIDYATDLTDEQLFSINYSAGNAPGHFMTFLSTYIRYKFFFDQDDLQRLSNVFNDYLTKLSAKKFNPYFIKRLDEDLMTQVSGEDQEVIHRCVARAVSMLITKQEKAMADELELEEKEKLDMKQITSPNVKTPQDKFLQRVLEAQELHIAKLGVGERVKMRGQMRKEWQDPVEEKEEFEGDERDSRRWLELQKQYTDAMEGAEDSQKGKYDKGDNKLKEARRNKRTGVSAGVSADDDYNKSEKMWHNRNRSTHGAGAATVNKARDEQEKRRWQELLDAHNDEEQVDFDEEEPKEGGGGGGGGGGDNLYTLRF
jgi:hypothetical protein